MEKKVASYTEKNERLQLVSLWSDDQSNLLGFELRANRVLIERFSRDQALYARLYFYHAVHEICVNRSESMLNLT